MPDVVEGAGWQRKASAQGKGRGACGETLKVSADANARGMQAEELSSSRYGGKLASGCVWSRPPGAGPSFWPTSGGLNRDQCGFGGCKHASGLDLDRGPHEQGFQCCRWLGGLLFGSPLRAER